MRPLSLRLIAFGSYPGTEVIDFVGLAVHGLFVVSGPTGSGKTTLFDAMTYALYGSLPGERPDDVRSHHAPANVETEVELVFEAEGHIYRVKRTPKTERLKARGTGTVAVAATAELYAVYPTGDVALASGKRDVDPRCIDLVGLSVDQFQRVVLLPQGKCAQFLLCKSDERQSLLQQLFGTQVFERATQFVQDRAVELRKQLVETDTEVDRLRKNARGGVAFMAQHLLRDPEVGEPFDVDPDITLDGIDDLIERFTPLVLNERQQLNALATRSTAAAAAYTSADTLASQWDDREAQVETLRLLEDDRGVIESDRTRAALARQAAPVLAVDALAASKRAELLDGASSCREAVELLTESLLRLGLDASVETAAAASVLLAEREAHLVADVQRVEALHSAESDVARIETDWAAATDTMIQLAERMASIDEELKRGTASANELEAVAGSLDRLRHAAQRSEELVARSEEQRADENAYQRAIKAADVATNERLRITAAFVADAAPRLADQLVADEPCPVCGSREHPARAVRHATEGVDREHLDAAVEQSQLADSTVLRLADRLAEHRRVLADRAEIDIESLREEHAANTAALQFAQQAAESLGDLREGLTALHSEADDLASQRAALNSLVAELKGALAAPRHIVDRLSSELADINTEILSAQRDALVVATTRVGELATRETEQDGLARVLEHVEEQCAHALLSSSFADIGAARAVEVSHEELQGIEASVERWQRELAEVTVRLAVLSKIDVPATRPETDSLRALAETLSSELHDATNRHSQLDLRLTDARSDVVASRQLLDDSGTKRAERATAERVATLCAGRNRMNVALETWVLAGELERVTAAANEHLTRMTRGRYRLERSGDSEDRRRRGGLDLVVHDADTGRARVPATLSGGEQFQASLALALGLADVVSQGGSGSGKVFEALFVDEGFGSLDPQALDVAIDALHELHATGRMVGVITHVEAMKQQLPIGLEVVVHADGVGSTLRQP